MRALPWTGARPARSGSDPWRAGSWGPLLLGLMACLAAYAAFAGGAIEIPAETRVQVVLALAGLAAVIGLCLGRLQVPSSPLAWAGVGALGLLAIWSALSISWSILPDASWLAANRATAYALVAAIALLAASSTRNAPTLVALGLAALALAVALYALAGKVFPGVSVGPLDLDPGDRFARLREPLDYWNALGLLCVLGAPVFVWLAAARDAAPRYRVGAGLCLTLLVVCAALSYSRGAIVAYAVALTVMVAAGPRRLTRLAAGAGAALAAGPALLLAFTRPHRSSTTWRATTSPPAR